MSRSPVKLHNPLAIRRHLIALAAAEGEGTGVPPATALSQLPARQTRRGLERILASGKSVEARRMAAWALGFLADDHATPALVRALSDRTEDTEVRVYAAEALGHLQPERGHDEALAALLHALTDREPAVRFWAAFALGNLGDDRAIPALQRLAERDSTVVPGWWSIQREALESIEQIKLSKGTREGVAGVTQG
jgi:HEAT repeat protein